MSQFSIDEACLKQSVQLPAYTADPSGKKKFVLARQLDVICEGLNEQNYLDFDFLAELVRNMSHAYYLGKPAKADEGEAFDEWAFAQNLYQTTIKLSALTLEDEPLSQQARTRCQSMFSQLKYSYLLHRLVEVRDMLSAYMGRWGYSDLWSCLDRITTEIESLHKAATGKKLNAEKRVRYWLSKLSQDYQMESIQLKKAFLTVFVDDYQQLWLEELTRVYQS